MKVVIIGAGPAGVSAVETIRAHDSQSEILVITSEPFPPYSPPAMADHFINQSNAHFWRGENWPDSMMVNYICGEEVVSIEPDEHLVRFLSGEVIPYDKLVIASGSRLHAPVEGAELPGVYNFKSLSAAHSLIDKVKQGQVQQALIVGAGFIGMEIALLLRKLGVKVTQVEMLNQVMPAMLDADSARIALDMMRQKGIEMRLQTRANSFIGDDQAVGIRLESGEKLFADVMVAATGVRPNLDFLEGSEIAHNWGIVVDEYLQTNKPDVYAAGDVVEAPDLITGERYVHAIFPNAMEQGNIVGLNVLGYETRYEGAHRMNSLKHLDLPILAAGLKTGEEILQVSRNGVLRTIYLEDNRVVGYQLVGDVKPAGVLRTLMNNRRDIRQMKDQLLDQGFGQGAITWQAITPWV